jgi:hypothetical protein
VQPRWVAQQERIIFTGSTRPDPTSHVTCLGYRSEWQEK